MTLTNLMNGKTPNADYEGFATASDFILAVNLATPAATAPGGYLVAQTGITEHSGTLNPTMADITYIRNGLQSTRTSTQRKFTVNGEVYNGDAFQDALLAHDIKFGTGKSVVREYVYFNMLTGKGEQGTLSISVETEPGGAAGANATFTATLSACGTPLQYTYTPAQ